MLDEKGIQTFFEGLHKLWIQPEVDRRFSETGIPSDFKILHCLIKLPKNQTLIVEFNDEVAWDIEHPELAPGVKMEAGKRVYLHEVVGLGKVLPPTIDGERVAFIYLYWNGLSYNVAFSLSPNLDDFDSEKDDFRLGEAIANHLWIRMIEMAVQNAKFVNAKLREIGLWPVTSLLPYPISKIVERVGEGKPEEAKQILVEHCDTNFLTERVVQTWHPVVAFRQRATFFDDALFNHQNKRFHGSISILVGQIEGVITDWLYEVNHYKTDHKRSLQRKTRDFRDALSKIPDLLWLYQEARDSMIDFLVREPWLQEFLWNQSINSSFPGRHVVQHGKYNKDVFTEENSIKLFLMLDSICQFMMFYEVRVLGRDLGQHLGN